MAEVVGDISLSSNKLGHNIENWYRCFLDPMIRNYVDGLGKTQLKLHKER